MNYYVASFFPFDTKEIQDFREKYDPKAHFIAPHITLIFPLPSSVKKNQLINHLKMISLKTRCFKVSIRGANITKDHFMYLNIESGSNSIVILHDNLYTGILKSHLRKKLRFTPHCTIGYFGIKNGTKLDIDKYNAACEELKVVTLKYDFVFKDLVLIGIDESKKTRIILNKFQLMS